MTLFLITLFVIFSLCIILNEKYDIQMLQQNSYRINRFFNWVRPNIPATYRMIYVMLLLLVCTTLLDIRLALIISAIVMVTESIILLRKKYKKPLVFTPRVRRIYSVTAVLTLIFSAAVPAILFRVTDLTIAEICRISFAFTMALAFFSWAVVILAVVILSPVEKMINLRYYNDARRILESMSDLKVIGITGSYGKTSTKHYLNRILSESYDVIMTPGSYNTPMGVIRTVREMMKPYNQIFICEMGAKQKGDIKEICDLVHPSAGIITAVGPMHLESFKTIENVQATKFELADALPSDGFVVVNNDFEYCASRPVSNVEAIRYGISSPENCSYRAEDIRYSPTGTTFNMVGPDGNKIPFTTKLVGECNISNLIAAIIVALRLEVPVDRIQYAVNDIQQVEHRLNMKRTPGGVTIIDDAFNSNPVGSRMAVEVLSHFDGGRRIIVTPGMIELGDRQFELNRQLGVNIGNNTDIAIIVGEYNRKALSEGIRSTDFDRENLHEVASFGEAQQLLSRILKKGDTVLYENDLPDTFR